MGYTQGVGEGKVQRLWIVNVDGQRLVILAGYFTDQRPETGATPEQVDELNTMVQSITFASPDQVAP